MKNIKEYLSYNPDTGIFIWIKKPSKKMKVGSVAGTKHHKGYIHVGYKGKIYQAHQLAWFFMYGEIPLYEIDHIDKFKDNNRIENLRLDINRENEQNNSKPRIDNTSGFRGVHWCERDKKWVAQIKINGKKIHLGSYDKPEEAHAAYLSAKKELHPFWIEKLNKSST